MYKIKLSPYHTIFYNEWKLQPDSSRYNIVFDQVLSENLDIKRLEGALYRFVSDCLIINSHVTQIEEELFWVRNTEIPKLEYFDSPYTRQQILNYVSIPFEIETKALYRFALFCEADGSYRFILVLHHLLIDGNSFNTLISQISNYYNSPTYKLEYTLPQQENALINSAQVLDEQLKEFDGVYQDFWKKYLNNIEPLDLRWVKSEDSMDCVKEYRFNFTRETMEKLTRITKKFDVTSYIYSKCVFSILLNRYTGQSEIGFCYPIAIRSGRPLISGAQINTNINIYMFNEETKITDLFDQTKDFVQSIKSTGQNAGYYPINKIMHYTNNNLLDIMFAQTNLKDKAFDFIDVETLKIKSELNIDLPVKIIFELEPAENILNFRVRYNTLKIDESILIKFIHHYERIFLNILDDLNADVIKSVDEYSVLSKLEYEEIVYGRNQTDLSYQFNKTIPELFEDQVRKTPKDVAVVYDGVQLTYLELNEQANQLAHYLIKNYSITGDDLIALYLDRSQYMIIAILGVLKAGAAYVPIDPTHPGKRVAYTLEDTKAKVLIVNSCHCNDLCKKNILPCSTDVLLIDEPTIQSKLKRETKDNSKLNITDANLVYVMYTSGTTGNPKGVMLEHGGVVARIKSMIEKNGMNNKDKYLFKTNYIFDVSFSDIFMTLLSGAILYVTKSVFDVDEIHNLIVKNDINVCHFVPSQLDLMQYYSNKEDIFKKLKIINLSGEGFKKTLIDKNYNIKYVNYYGPTEAGEVSYDITDFKNKLVTHERLMTIGYPLDQSTLYVLDNSLRPLPVGALGELYIGGMGLARGYLNLPQLTAERFISNPFQTKKEKELNQNSRLYKTGDLVRYLPDGNIEYIGRKDNQVKIHGLRIELGEIEAKLSNYSGIKQAVVLCQQQTDIKDRNKQSLVAYYVSDDQLDENLILTYLTLELPDYMIPSAMVWLSKLPLTRNGKLDLQLLPKVCFIQNADDYIAPRNESEQRICAIYADILGLTTEQVGVNDSFFKLGGNSILAIRLIFKLQPYFEVGLNNIFELKTPAKLAQCLRPACFKLTDKLEEVKSAYLKLNFNEVADNRAIERERILYEEQMKSFKFDNKVKSMCKVLLTGATGYLGCHILYQLLTTTNHLVYLPIRGSSKEAVYARLSDKFRYYFQIDLKIFFDRIKVFVSDLSKANLGLDKAEYEKLIHQVDSIIHSAARVKHYGDSTEFYLQNVQATTNLLEFAKTTNKDFHYVSTIGVFTNMRLSEESYNIFTENNIDSKEANLDNLYTKTKYEGEQVTLKYREYGVRTNIYRIGNLAFNSATYKTQENIEDNAFFQCIKTMLKLGIIPKELSEADISPVDYTATTIVSLFDQAELYNQIYHVFNPHKSDLYTLLKNYTELHIEKVSFSKFIDTILAKLKDGNNMGQIELFMLHQSWLQSNISNLAKTVIFQDKTKHILAQLNIECPSIASKMFCNIIKQVKESSQCQKEIEYLKN